MATPYVAKKAQIVEDEPQAVPRSPDKFDELRSWVLDITDSWRNWRDANYSAAWDTYERLWRGKWDANERLRESERSRVVTPALSEAVENAAAEIEEVITGRGVDYFDLELDTGAIQAMIEPGAAGMPPPGGDPFAALAQTREALREDLHRSDFAANVVEAVLYSAVFGTGFGEIVMTDRAVLVPSPDGLGALERRLPVPSLRALSPRHVLVDPNAKTLDEGLGVAVEERLPLHLLEEQQAAGTLRGDVDLCAPAPSPDPGAATLGELDAKAEHDRHRAVVLRWYGKVPTKLLFPETKPAKDAPKYTEAIVVIVNRAVVAKAVTNPAPFGDRPVVAFPWDAVPGRLHGRGVCEKGEMSQRILDAEVRARLDSLALTYAPMLGLDATRIPRNETFKVFPGATLLTLGPPSEAITPLKFGELDPNHWQNAAALQAMVHQATGSMDATAVASRVGDARSGAVSMAMAPVIKRYKRTLVRFFDLFLMPALEKIVSRARQSMPQRYPAVPLRVRPASTMGIMQREFETAQLTQLLMTLEPGSPEHSAILMGVVANTSIPHRETVIRMLAQRVLGGAPGAQQAEAGPPPELLAAAADLEMREKAARVSKLEAQAEHERVKAAAVPAQVQAQILAMATKGMYAVPEDQQAAEFDRRLAIADRMIEQERIEERARDRESNERIAALQMAESARQKAADRDLKLRLAAARQRGT